MAFFRRNNTAAISPQQLQVSKYFAARANLLLVVAFTLINVIFALFDGSSYFLFSAFAPYYLAVMAMIMCGKYSPEYYEEVFGESVSNMEFFGNDVFVTIIAIAFIILALYVVCWIFSKRKVGWMITALVLFTVDSAMLVLFYGITIDMILDILFHVWVLYYLIAGIVAFYKLKAMNENEVPLVLEAPIAPEGETEGETAEESETEKASVRPDSNVIRRADSDKKARVLLELKMYGHDVCYRRVGKVNELVIDNMVYDEVEMLFEKVHSLFAVIDGHEIQVGYDGSAQSYAIVDGARVASRVRLI